MAQVELELGIDRSKIEALKCACMNLAKEPSRQSVDILRKILEHFDTSALRQVQEFVVFPLVMTLKQKRSANDLHKDTADCLKFLLNRIEVKQSGMFLEVFNCLTILLSPPESKGQSANHSEELKLSLLGCLENLLVSSSGQVLRSVYTPVYLPALGHAVSCFLYITEHEESRTLKIQAMSSLLALAQAQTQTKGLAVQSGSVFASFLPGIALSLCRVTTGDTKQGQAVIKKALETWSSIVSRVLNDKDLTKANDTSACLKKGVEKYQDLIVERSETWVKSTAEKLHILVQRIVGIVSHDHWKVRLALAGWAECLLLSCANSMTNSLPLFLETLVTLSGDSYPVVAEKSALLLGQFLEEPSQRSCLLEILEESLHTLATSLPRLVRVNDDTEKLVLLRCFHGYIKIMGPRVKSMFMSFSHLQRVVLAIVQVLELDCSDIKVLEERLTDSDDRIEVHSLQSMTRPKKNFKHFQDAHIFTEIQCICRHVGINGDICILVDHLMDLFGQSSVHYKQVILVINEVLLGCAGIDVDRTDKKQSDSSEELEDYVKLLVTEYVSKLSSPLTNSSKESDHSLNKTSQWIVANHIGPTDISSLSSIKTDIWLKCLLLESFGVFSRILGSRFNHMLMDVLYPVLEMLGVETAIVSQSAYITLQEICANCGYASIGDLIRQNADYLVSALSLRLRHVERHPAAPVVLQVIFQYSDQDVLPLTQQTVQEVLQLLDTCGQSEHMVTLKVLHTLVLSIAKWYPGVEDQMSIGKGVSEPVPDNCSRSVGQYILDYQEHKKIAEGDFKDEDVPCPDSDSAENEMGEEDCTEKEPEIPYHVSIVTEVMDRCRHFLSSKHSRVRLLVLDLIAAGCRALRHWQNQLLPMIHKVWQPFVQRFQDSEMFVIQRAIDTLHIMSEHAGNFIQNRTTKDALPRLCDLMLKQSLVSAKVGHNYIHTAACKLQLAILTRFGDIVKNLEIVEIDLDEVTSACLPYLSARQPIVLQQACLKTFLCFIRLEPDSMWLKLGDVYYARTLVPPVVGFKEIVLAGSCGGRTEFTDNILSLLDVLENEGTLREID